MVAAARALPTNHFSPPWGGGRGARNKSASKVMVSQCQGEGCAGHVERRIPYSLCNTSTAVREFLQDKLSSRDNFFSFSTKYTLSYVNIRYI